MFKRFEEKKSLTAISSAAASEPEIKTFVLGKEEERTAPESFDFRAVRAVTAVKDQKWCNTCWAMSGIGVIEFYFKKTRNLNEAVSLSVQSVIDCAKYPKFLFIGKCLRWGDQREALKFAQKNGVRLESTDPYKARVGKCDLSKRTFKLHEMEIWSIRDKNEETMKEALYRYGPMSCNLHVPNISFKEYRKGVFDCKEYEWQGTFGHGVLLVGYGTDPKDGDYWIIKNSEGVKWGENGYMRLARNRNACNVTHYVHFVT